MDTKSCFNLIEKENGETKKRHKIYVFKHAKINEAKSTESLIVSVAALCLSFPGNPASNLEKKISARTVLRSEKPFMALASLK